MLVLEPWNLVYMIHTPKTHTKKWPEPDFWIFAYFLRFFGIFEKKGEKIPIFLRKPPKMKNRSKIQKSGSGHFFVCVLSMYTKFLGSSTNTDGLIFFWNILNNGRFSRKCTFSVKIDPFFTFFNFFAESLESYPNKPKYQVSSCLNH